MAFYIPDDKLAEVRSNADIVEIISERVMLKKAGKDYIGLCPFHTEKTPSFTVSPDKQIFHCFGCGVGGDVFGFIMKHDRMSFPEAVLSIARKYGIEIVTQEMSQSRRKEISEREQLLVLNHRVKQFYIHCLRKGPKGEFARRYLEKRGIDREIIDRFAIGYAPDGWDHLVRFLQKSKVPFHLAEKAGLIVPKKSGGYYDRFRNRIIFPIFDIAGQVIGFGGRVMDDAKPKYLNSPETPLYNKRNTLYGLQTAREKCRETQAVFIVEGYFDLLAMNQHGITNAVATLGTALTAEHVRRLKGYAKTAYLVFDSDAAGIKAAQRTIGIFMNEAISASVVLLPEGDDPDSFLFGKGADAFLALADKALGLVPFLIEQSVNRHGLSMEGKVRIIADLTPPLTEITDSVARSLYIQHLAERIGVDEAAVMEKIRSARAQQTRRAGRESQRAGADAQPEASGSGARVQHRPMSDRLELRIITMMIQCPESIPAIVAENLLDMIEDSRLKAIGETIVAMPEENLGNVADLMSRLADEEQRRLVAKIAVEDVCWDAGSCEKLMSQFLNTRRRRENDLIRQIRAAEENDDHELMIKLLSEKLKQIGNRHP